MYLCVCVRVCVSMGVIDMCMNVYEFLRDSYLCLDIFHV